MANSFVPLSMPYCSIVPVGSSKAAHASFCQQALSPSQGRIFLTHFRTRCSLSIYTTSMANLINIICMLLQGTLNLPRLKSRGSQPRILTDSDTLGYPRSSYGSCICYAPAMRSPSFRIFMAAFMSLSWTAPHCRQAHSRTDKSFVSECLCPQQ